MRGPRVQEQRDPEANQRCDAPFLDRETEVGSPAIFHLHYSCYLYLLDSVLEKQVIIILGFFRHTRFYDEITEVEAPARIISQSVVKFIGEYSDKFGDDFHLYLDKLRSYVNSFMVDKGVLVSIIFLEALERPLVFR